MNRYQKGRRYEYEVKWLFEQAGYEVTRASSSKSPFDLVCTKLTDDNKKVAFVAFIQCKVSKLRKQEPEDQLSASP